MPHTFLNRIRLFMRCCYDDLSRGLCYQHGRYVSQDIETALMFYTRAVQNGNLDAYELLGQIHEQRENIEFALRAYLDGAVRGHSGSKNRLITLSEHNVMAKCYVGELAEHEGDWLEAKACYKAAIKCGNTDAMYSLGRLYEDDRFADPGKSYSRCVIKKDMLKALMWYRRAATAFSSRGLNALIGWADTEPKASFHLAQMHENGEGVPKNMSLAVTHYKKASDLIEATVRLAQLYELGCGGIKRDLRAACLYYLTAAVLNDKDSLAKSEQIVTMLKDSTLEYELGKVYEDTVQSKMTALVWYKKAADRRYEAASRRLKEIASRDAEFAYAVAKSYEKEGLKTTSSRQKSLDFYVMAACDYHLRAIKILETAAMSGDAEAQYAFGHGYHLHRKNTMEAIKWCMKAAEQGQAGALKYLNETQFSADICLEIARQYERGEWVHLNMQRAFEFYGRASRLGSKEATFCLAQLYQVDHGDVERNTERAVNYYIQAVKQGHREAAVALDRLREDMNAKMVLSLGDVYRSFSLDDPDRALECDQLAVEMGHPDAKRRLSTCPKKSRSDRSVLMNNSLFFSAKEYQLRCPILSAGARP